MLYAWRVRAVLIDQFVRRATVVRVIDGDTFIADVDLGYHVTMTESFRLLGVDTPERHGATKDAGEAARLFTALWLGDRGNQVWLRSHKTEKFGRWLAEVYDDAGESLRAALLTAGHAVEYGGGKRAAAAIDNPMFKASTT